MAVNCPPDDWKVVTSWIYGALLQLSTVSVYLWFWHKLWQFRYWSVSWSVSLCCIPDHVSIRHCFNSFMSHLQFSL